MSTLIVEQETLPLSNRIDGIMVRELVSIAVGSRWHLICVSFKYYQLWTESLNCDGQQFHQYQQT
jgi:hypothetical protein